MTRSFSFPILLISLLFVTISLSALNTQTPLWLVREHFDVWKIGLVGSSYFVGNLVGTFVANWFVAKINAKKTYCYTCLLFAVSTLGMSISMDLYSWSFCRFLIGIACAITWVIVESCILVTSKANNRSKMLAVYMTTYYLGTVMGQGLLRFFPTQVVHFGLVVTMLMALAILFILLTHYHLPHKKKKAFDMMSMIFHRQARLGLVGCIIAGMIIGGIYSLMPVYYAKLGFNDEDVANWMIVIITSGLLAQIPAGYFADKYGRSRVLVIETFIFMLACVMLIIGIFPVIAAIIMGATIYTVYPLAMAWACSTVNKQEIILMNQAMLFVNTLGSLVAPAIISFFMTEYGNNSLFVCFILIALLFAVLLMLSARVKRPALSH
ncbi:MFS transporter [Utexia brackfieldae]|uniref:MFS transporter n=1 Tax=Utexia brackfieldae TaxID=3074108 RepID=UPI00370DA074